MYRLSGRLGFVHNMHFASRPVKGLTGFRDQKRLLFGIEDIHVVLDGCLLYIGMGMVHNASTFGTVHSIELRLVVPAAFGVEGMGVRWTSEQIGRAHV